MKLSSRDLRASMRNSSAQPTSSITPGDGPSKKRKTPVDSTAAVSKKVTLPTSPSSCATKSVAARPPTPPVLDHVGSSVGATSLWSSGFNFNEVVDQRFSLTEDVSKFSSLHPADLCDQAISAVLQASFLMRQVGGDCQTSWEESNKKNADLEALKLKLTQMGSKDELAESRAAGLQARLDE